MLSEATAKQIEKVNEVPANVTPGLIFLQISAVRFASLAHQENLVRAMVTGKKRV